MKSQILRYELFYYSIGDMARDNDYQIWMERVGKGDECQVIIEDEVVLK